MDGYARGILKRRQQHQIFVYLYLYTQQKGKSKMKGLQEVVEFQGLKFKLLYEDKQVYEAIDNMMKEIHKKIHGIKQKDPSARIVFVGILNGAFMLMSEIAKRLDIDVIIDFMKCRSYVGESSEELQVISEFDWEIVKGSYVLIVDDICDTGRTLIKLLGLFKQKGAAEVETAVLIRRPDKKHAVEPNYCGLVCNAFIVGFGLDFNQFGRQFPCIYQKIQE